MAKGYDAGEMKNLSHLNLSKPKDKAGVEYGLSEQMACDVDMQDPSMSTDGSAPFYSTQRITENPRKESASKNGKSFDIC